jgi:hypothetical protein
LLCLALLSAAPLHAAYAQPATAPPEEAKAAAKVAADKGKQHFDAGRYQEAIAAFREADAHFHAPTFLLMMARAHDKLGRLREARALYQQVIDEKLAHYAPRVFFDAQASARKEIGPLTERIPMLEIQVTGAAGKDARVTVDGQQAAIGEPLPQDPGEHTVTGATPGRAPVTRVVTLAERASQLVTLDLFAPPPPPPPAPRRVEVRRPAAPEPPAETKRGFLAPAAIAFGVAGAAVAVGAVTGALAAPKASALLEECPGQRCYDDAGGETYDSAQTLATISTLGFVTGAVAAVAGVTLLLWPRKAPRTAEAAPRLALPAAHAAVVVTPGWLGMRGGF